MNNYCARELEALRQYTNSREEAIEILDTGGSYGDQDIEYNGFRFIYINDIDDILEDELANDTFILGCFNASFLSSITGITQRAFELCQENDAHDIIGELIISGNYLSELVREYVAHDGYGNHFSHYDGSENTLYINGHLYYAFNVEGLVIVKWEDDEEESQDFDTNYSINESEIEQGIHSLNTQSLATVKDPTTGDLLDSNTLLPVDSVVDFTKVKFSDLF